MTVLETANLKLFSCQRKLSILMAKKELGTKTDADDEIKNYEEKVKYWMAFIDGVKAQRNEQMSEPCDENELSEQMIMRTEDE